MRYSIIGWILCLLTLHISCSNPSTNERPSENQQKIGRYYNKALKNKYKDYFEIPKYADSIDEAAINENSNYKALGFIARGIYYLKIEDLSETFSNFNEAEILLQKDGPDSLKIVVHNGLGNYHTSLGDYPKSLEELLKALKLAEKNNDTISIAGVNSNMGQLYLQKGDQSLAKINLNNTLALLKHKKHEPAYLLASHTMANIYGMSGDIESALKIDEEGLRISDSIKSNNLKVTFLDNKANCFMYSGQLDSAKVYFNECLRLDFLSKNKKQISDSYSNLAQLAVFSENEKEVREFANKSIELAKEIEYTPGLIKIYQTLIDYYTSKNNPELASEYQNAYLQVYKKLLTERGEAAMVQYKTQYETEKKENELLISEATVSKKNRQLQLSVISILGLLVISYLIYRQQKTKNKQQHQEFQLKSALKEIELQNQLQEQRLVISRDLHDNVGAQLTCIISSVENLKFRLKNTDIKTETKFEKQLNAINTITRETIVELRDTIWAMNSNTFTFEDLRARILNFVIKIKEINPTLNFTFHIDETLKETEISSVKGMNIYRIIQEALNNAIKYAEAASIEVSIKLIDTESVRVSIFDNGKGFVKGAVELGNGILNMEKRALDIKGDFQLNSQLDKGTEIIITLNQFFTND